MNSDKGIGSFVLGGIDAAFGSRTKDIFASLDTIEAKHAAFENTTAARQECEALLKPDPTDEDSVPNADSKSFRVPACPPKKKMRSDSQCKLPGFKAEPSKWTMYDLSDIADGDMTESSNSNAAMDFLKTRQQPLDADAVRCSEEEVKNSSSSGVRHVFRKPVQKTAGGATCSLVTKKNSTVALKTVIEKEDSDDEEPESAALESQFSDISGPAKSAKYDDSHFRDKHEHRIRKRGHGKDDDSSDDDEQKTAEPEAACHALALGDDSDSDDFSELNTLESDSDEEHNGKGTSRVYISDTGIVSQTEPIKDCSYEEDCYGEFDGVD